jgi:EAL domain-containing protein (putative c-di-GMP-specific phosphodiesterase class I)
LPIDKLKVDKSFVLDISNNSDDAAIVAAIIDMAHNLIIGVIAEGVETEAQMQYLRDRKCDEVQGYYFSKPLADDLLENYLSSEGFWGRSL